MGSSSVLDRECGNNVAIVICRERQFKTIYIHSVWLSSVKKRHIGTFYFVFIRSHDSETWLFTMWGTCTFQNVWLQLTRSSHRQKVTVHFRLLCLLQSSTTPPPWCGSHIWNMASWRFPPPQLCSTAAWYPVRALQTDDQFWGWYRLLCVFHLSCAM